MGAKKLNENSSTDFSVHISTESQINKFLQENDLSIGGKIINELSLKIVTQKKDLDPIGSNEKGCYFIFSNLKETEIPCFSEDGYKGYKKFIQKEGETFRCLYNGKGNKIKERLFEHIFNNHTIHKIQSESHKNSKISGTGAMSLSAISQAKLDEMQVKKQYNPKNHNLKPLPKSLHANSNLKYEGMAYMLNGIDITEEPWSKYKFAVCVVKTESEFGKILIEEAFSRINGRPPLCRRHG